MKDKESEVLRIASCGMNCNVCYAHLRKKNKCSGCRTTGIKRKGCDSCKIKTCIVSQHTANSLCYDCEKFPCSYLKQFDTTYRKKYRVSLIENLTHIRDKGIESFLKTEKEKWICSACSKKISIHWKTCEHCGKTFL